MQADSRRLSARLQEKDDAQLKSTGLRPGGGIPREVAKAVNATGSNSRKRKNDYEEEDDGFTFSRVSKNKKPRQSRSSEHAQTAPSNTTTTMTKNAAPVVEIIPPPSQSDQPAPIPADDVEMSEAPKRRKKKMSFSTPKAKESQTVRRSKRLSNEVEQRNNSPVASSAAGKVKVKKRPRKELIQDGGTKSVEAKELEMSKDVEAESIINNAEAESEHSATKIALPFADTPVIRRNKAMREGKSMKGDRRSSLGLRGRRASSLIDTGNSNALPHQEVEVTDFFKHIESDLMEPRRMRQLLTWCATRAMHAKPKGTDFEDASAKSAARIIEEELLKDLSNRSEFSDWFSREEAPQPPQPLPERPNPKNIQNLQKIGELEEQINRLKIERDALQQLLEPPDVTEMDDIDNSEPLPLQIDRTLLSEDDMTALDALTSTLGSSEQISARINDIARNVGPSVDRFADGIHKVAQYRDATDNVAGKILSICASKLSDREKAGRRKALQTDEDRSPGRDLSNVLRGLSKVDR